MQHVKDQRGGLKRSSFKFSCHQFDMKNPFKIYSISLQFYKRIPFQFFSEKKIHPEIWSQKYPPGPTSWTIFEKSHPSIKILKIFGPTFVTNKKVTHFFIQMQLLPKTPPSTFLKKKNKDQNMRHFSLFTVTFTHFDKHGGSRSIAGTKDSPF